MSEDNGIERARYVTRVAELDDTSEGYRRLYFGNEFCECLIPTAAEMDYALDHAHARGLGFTLVTPYVTDRSLVTLETLFRQLAAHQPGSEVVFNDWGVLTTLNEVYPALVPVMGRLLHKMKRGPRFVNLQHMLPESTLRYYRSSSLDSPLYQGLLREWGVRRVELDNLLQGVEAGLGGSEIRASLHLPYAVVSTTRLCLTAGCDVVGAEETVGIFPCRRECQRYTFKLTHPVMPVPIIRQGNTMFFKNDRLPENMTSQNIDRLVVAKAIPI